MMDRALLAVLLSSCSILHACLAVSVGATSADSSCRASPDVQVPAHMIHPGGNDHGILLQNGVRIQTVMQGVDQPAEDEGAFDKVDTAKPPRPGTLISKKLDEAPAPGLRREASMPLEKAEQSSEKTPSVVNNASPVNPGNKVVVATAEGTGEEMQSKAVASNAPLFAAAKAESLAAKEASDGHRPGQSLIDKHDATKNEASWTRDWPPPLPDKPSSGDVVLPKSHNASTPKMSDAIQSVGLGPTLLSLYAMMAMTGLQKCVLGSILILMVLALATRSRRDQKNFKQPTQTVATISRTNASLTVDTKACKPIAEDNSMDVTLPLSFLQSLGLDNHPVGNCVTSELGSAVVAIKWEVEPCKQHFTLNVASFDSDNKGESSKVVMRLQSWEAGQGEEVEGVELQNSAGVPLASLTILRAWSPEGKQIEPENRRVSLCLAGGSASMQPLMTFYLKSADSEAWAEGIVAEGNPLVADRRLDLAVAQLVGCDQVSGRHVVVAHRGNGDGEIDSEPLMQVLLDEEGQPTTVFHGNGIDVLAEFGIAGPPFSNGWRALRATMSNKDLPLMVAAVVAARKLAL